MENGRKRMDDAPKWLYDEFHSPGVDYQKDEVVGDYEKRHAGFRDFSAEARRALDRIGPLSDDATLIDLGCGPGTLTIEFAPRFRRIDAADVSDKMLSLFRRKIEERKVENIFLHHHGFLTYRHEGEPADVLFTSIALHHLPDFWKACAFDRMRGMIKPGGFLYLTDVIFHFDVSDWREGTETLLSAMGHAAGHEADLHIQREFSSFDWILEGIFEKTGFEILRHFDENDFLRTYLLKRR